MQRVFAGNKYWPWKKPYKQLRGLKVETYLKMLCDKLPPTNTYEMRGRFACSHIHCKCVTEVSIFIYLPDSFLRRLRCVPGDRCTIHVRVEKPTTAVINLYDQRSWKKYDLQHSTWSCRNTMINYKHSRNICPVNYICAASDIAQT